MIHLFCKYFFYFNISFYLLSFLFNNLKMVRKSEFYFTSFSQNRNGDVKFILLLLIFYF